MVGKGVPNFGTVLNRVYAVASKIIMGLGTTGARVIFLLIQS